MIAYLDSSVLLRVVLGQRNALKEWGRVTQGIASALAEVECLRTLDRLRLAQGFADEMIAEQREAVYRLLEAMEIVEITHPVLSRSAEPLRPGTGNAGRDSSCFGVAVEGTGGKGLVDGDSRRGIGCRREGKLM